MHDLDIISKALIYLAQEIDNLHMEKENKAEQDPLKDYTQVNIKRILEIKDSEEDGNADSKN